MIIACQARVDDPFAHRGEERGGNPVLVQAWTIVRESGGIEDRLGRVQAAEPAEEQVGVQPLDQLALASHRVDALQQQSLEQDFRWNAGPSDLAVTGGQTRAKLRQHRIDHLSDRPQRMVCSNAVLDIDRVEHRRRLLRWSLHPQIFAKSPLSVF